MIDFKEGAVFYASNRQYRVNGSRFQGYNDTLESWQRSIEGSELEETLAHKDFQLNEPREGCYIPKSELDTEEKYNQAVEVFGLFGYVTSFTSYRSFIDFDNLLIDSDGDVCACRSTHAEIETKITFNQLMAIGELKRKMNERDEGSAVNAGAITMTDGDIRSFYNNGGIGKTKRRNKSKQAYDILKDLDYEYDLVKQQWYKKEWV